MTASVTNSATATADMTATGTTAQTVMIAARTAAIMAGIAVVTMGGIATIVVAGPSGGITATCASAAEVSIGAAAGRSGHTAVLPYSCLVTGWLDESPPSTAIA